MELNFSKICRVCLNEGVMMSLFKVNISKKMMACASVQVWQNDGLPSQICNKCSAKLHISFQFKRQCEKSDSKLRQYLTDLSSKKEQNLEPLQQNQDRNVFDQQLQSQQMHHQPIQQEGTQLQQVSEQNQNCVFIECAPLIELQQDDRFDGIVNQSQSIAQLNYNLQPQSNLPISGYIQGVGPLQVYNGTAYTLPIQQQNMLQNQIVGPPLQVQQMPELPLSESVLTQEQQQLLETPLDPKEKSNSKDLKSLGKSNDNRQCITCGKIFATSTKLSRHMKTHSSDMPYKCKICNKAFSHSGNFKIHLRMHTDERPFKCTVCNKGCRQAQDLEKHMRTHTGERPHKCTMCIKAFSTRSNLIAHIRTHTGERPYVCCVCQKAFCQSNELTKHMRTHTGEKSHICDICHKGFNGSSTLIVHRRSHTGERPYVCQICKKGFVQSSCLIVHIRRHAGDKKFECFQCKKQFVTNADLKAHLLTHSEEEKPFSCSECHKVFLKGKDLQRHSKSHIIFS